MKQCWSRFSARTIVIAALLIVTPTVVAQEATPVGSSQGITLAASGLDNPRGFGWGADSTLFVTQARMITAGTEGAATPVASGDLIGGLDGNVASVVGGCPVVYQGVLPSAGGRGGVDLGPSDLAFLNGQMYVLDEGGGAAHGNPLTPSGVYAIDGSGAAQLVADIGAWVAANPVAKASANPDPDGDPFAMIAAGGALWVSEADGGQLLKITPDGTITRIVDFSADGMVPTGLASTADGSIMVGLTAADSIAEGTSKVVKVASDGTVADAWTGLTAVTSVAISQSGTLFALEMGSGGTDDQLESIQPNTGRVVRQTGSNTMAVVATGLNLPLAMAFGPDQGLYVSSPAFSTTAQSGSIVRLNTSQGQVMTMSDDILAKSPCITKPTPTPDAPTVAPTQDGSPVTSPTAAGGAAVTIENFAFGTASLTVSVGETVTWTNKDAVPHTVTSDDGVFDSGTIAPGDTFSYTFDKAGSFAYHCDFHPGMKATVIAGGAPAPEAPTSEASPITGPTAEAGTPAPAGAAVTIENFAFGTASLTVSVGETVTWTNKDAVPHTVTSDDGVWDSGTVAPGDTFSYTFDKAGSFAYHCNFHPGMKATIVAQ